ncbi:MAG: M13 family metallopeptidase, partial [Planctomycetaceae bacterium]|nr:M13 family metallopeptidase [Planctomycetaceae bacterium]
MLLVATVIGSHAAGEDRSPDGKLSGRDVLFRTDFEQSGTERFEFTDTSAWSIGTNDGNHFLSLTKKRSDFEPPVRSPYNRALIRDLQAESFVLDVRLQSTIPDYNHRDLCLFFGYQDDAHLYYVHLGKRTDDHANQIFIVDNEPRKKISTKTTPGTDWTDEWHHARVVRDAVSGEIAVYFDDMQIPVMTAIDKTFVRGRVGVGSFDDIGNFDDIIVFGPNTSAPEAEPFSGIDPDGFDRTVRPQDDLYQHVNGRWLMSTQIPADKSNYGSFTALDDAARENIREIIEAAAENPVDDNSRKVGDFYRSYMNEDLAEQRGLVPVKDELADINGLTDMEGVFRHLGHLQTIGVDGPVAFFVGVDAKNSTQHLAAIVQSGTTLPDRDYYLEDDEKYLKAREALKAYTASLFQLAEIPNGETAASSILKLETRLAEIQWSRTELRDAERRYNKYHLADLPDLAPELPWPLFFDAVGVESLEYVNVMTPSYFQGLQAVGNELDLDTAKNYLRFRLLDAAAPLLSKPFVDAHFELHDRQLAGIPEQKPRWKRAVDATSGGGAGDFGVLGEAVGQIYVAKHFQPEAKRSMDALVANLLQAYENSIHDLEWMTAETKQKALEKLHRITPKIGYPEKWRDYSKLEIRDDDLVGNIRRSMTFEHNRMLEKLGRRVDRTEWGMTPQTVNAYYN